MRERAINRILNLNNKFSKRELEKKFQEMETLDLVALSYDMKEFAVNVEFFQTQRKACYLKSRYSKIVL